MNIKKLYKVTKITPLSNSEWKITDKMGDYSDFQAFLATARKI